MKTDKVGVTILIIGSAVIGGLFRYFLERIWYHDVPDIIGSAVGIVVVLIATVVLYNLNDYC